MKKYLSIICATAMLLSCYGCGDSAKKEKASTSESSIIEPTTKEQTEPPTEEVTRVQSKVLNLKTASLSVPEDWETLELTEDDGYQITVNDGFEVELWDYTVIDANGSDEKLLQEYAERNLDDNGIEKSDYVTLGGKNCFTISYSPYEDGAITTYCFVENSVHYKFWICRNNNANASDVESAVLSMIESFEQTDISELTLNEISISVDPAVIEHEYKDKCQALDYETIARDRNGLEGTFVQFTGQIIQDVGDGSYRMAITKEGSGNYTYYTDAIMIYYDDQGVGDRILVDDIVTIWGESVGLFSYETVMGDTMTVPLISVRYMELIEE